MKNYHTPIILLPIPSSIMSNNSHISSEALLNKVDKLRELNIAQHVGLPQVGTVSILLNALLTQLQLVVVGDQSSGKSSLLESLSGIPFPRDVNLCTRYATQISSRRDQTYRVDISIIPAPNSTPEHIQNISSFSPPSLGKHDFKTRFPEILGQVNEVMGISMGEDSSNGSVFSEDILKIEICGPKEDYLTIIDVPGIFRVAGGLTTPQDVALVRNIVTKYIKDKWNIILAVIPSNVDIATQEILSLAKEHDPQGERTLGILTKPDLVSEKSAQSAVCALIEGHKHPLSLGYYIVRNRGADDHDPFTSSGALALDQFFNQSPWSELPRHRIGISSLKRRLGELLEELTSREVPALVHELKEKLKTAKSALGSLGPGRSTPEEQRLLLGQIAKDFESLTKDALSSTYNRRPDFENVQLRLNTNLSKLSGEFSRLLFNMGHTWEMDEVKLERRTMEVKHHIYDKGHRHEGEFSIDTDADDENRSRQNHQPPILSPLNV
ncbi:Interferon-induced GTP-binding protein Mx1 [Ceratocystis fimbriata CBS 114723]|uniref:Interferon-induced GTP-binding protein Mx1 n=1 Tax=Ceratocystis fimbriata CBS 114723 TaxID=1035309 RepID=A0A2C5XM23_9PEZI|nr:Interferon-induced GTP-binding protein Mx1 [Ceratocystis fimbriata CBS 114723]